MMSLPRPIDKTLRLVAEGRLAEVAHRVRSRFEPQWREQSLAYGLRRDLATQFPAPAARIPIHVRPIEGGDVPILFPADQSRFDPADRQELAWRRAYLDAQAPACFVAVDERTGEPCYMQWLLRAEQNAFLQPMRLYPVLKADEALLENAYTPPSHRGLGVMAAAMAMIAERAGESVRHVYTFVGFNNGASLKGCARSGFTPVMVRRSTSLCFGLVKRVAFEALPEHAPS